MLADTGGFAQASSHETMSDYDVVNVGAAGTFVVRKPGSRQNSAGIAPKTAIRRRSRAVRWPRSYAPGDGESVCAEPSSSDVVRFVSILSKAGGVRASLPVTFPSDGAWLVRVIASDGQFVFGMYRRHMKTIGYLGQIDKLYGVPATRNWNTISRSSDLEGPGSKVADGAVSNFHHGLPGTRPRLPRAGRFRSRRSCSPAT